MTDYREKYLKYKSRYLLLKSQNLWCNYKDNLDNYTHFNYLNNYIILDTATQKSYIQYKLCTTDNGLKDKKYLDIKGNYFVTPKNNDKLLYILEIDLGNDTNLETDKYKQYNIYLKKSIDKKLNNINIKFGIINDDINNDINNKELQKYECTDIQNNKVIVNAISDTKVKGAINIPITIDEPKLI